jgi:hypothetical protein
MNATTKTGSCLCGAVEFEFHIPTLFAAHCHCSMCRRGNGAGFVTWIGVRKDGFRITAGAGDLTVYRSSDRGTRSFCGRCGSSMLCQNDDQDNVIDITLANIHGEIDRSPSSHVYFDCRAPWVKVNDDLRKRGGDTGGELLKDPD